ncbi:hypothetical protein QYE88_42485, partial [Enterobacter hormaechei subsp. steigerwaltii]|nr:hypothetical protein [Enterobacter hormaechei subsp. steigerwaltii]
MHEPPVQSDRCALSITNTQVRAAPRHPAIASRPRTELRTRSPIFISISVLVTNHLTIGHFLCEKRLDGGLHIELG